MPESTLWGWAPGPWKRKQSLLRSFPLLLKKPSNLFARWTTSASWYDHIGVLAGWTSPSLLLTRLLHRRARAAADVAAALLDLAPLLVLMLLMLMALQVLRVVGWEGPGGWLGDIRLILKMSKFYSQPWFSAAVKIDSGLSCPPFREMMQLCDTFPFLTKICHFCWRWCQNAIEVHPLSTLIFKLWKLFLFKIQMRNSTSGGLCLKSIYDKCF